MSKTSKEYWMEEASKFEGWFYRANYMRVQQEADNVALRELVADMWEGYNDPRCDECHLKDTPTCTDCPICAMEASVRDRMHELGVEVD